MKQTTVTTINDKAIQIIFDKNEKLVPIKPICEALGIDYPAQYTKVNNDSFLSSTVVLSTMVGQDKKQREMTCLPHKYIFGWLFTINPGNVKEEAKEAVLKYRIECYDALFNHFSEKSNFSEEKQEMVNKALEAEDIANQNFNASKKERDEAKKKVELAKHLDFNEWKDSKNEQLKINFEQTEDVN